jgi:hypothetical protein
MRAWITANGGALAVAALGITVGGFNNRTLGAILIVLSLVWYLGSLVWNKPPPAQTSAMRANVGVHATLQAHVIPGPNSPTAVSVSFEIEQSGVTHVGLSNRPVRIRLMTPVERTVTAESLPHIVRRWRVGRFELGKRLLVVTHFSAKAFTVESARIGMQCRAQVYYRGPLDPQQIKDELGRLYQKGVEIRNRMRASQPSGGGVVIRVPVAGSTDDGYGLRVWEQSVCQFLDDNAMAHRAEHFRAQRAGDMPKIGGAITDTSKPTDEIDDDLAELARIIDEL